MNGGMSVDGEKALFCFRNAWHRTERENRLIIILKRCRCCWNEAIVTQRDLWCVSDWTAFFIGRKPLSHETERKVIRASKPKSFNVLLISFQPIGVLNSSAVVPSQQESSAKNATLLLSSVKNSLKSLSACDERNWMKNEDVKMWKCEECRCCAN